MEIVVCVKRVPDLGEADVEVTADGRSIRTDDLVFGVNEWDNFAVEEAIRLRETHGGTVTVVTVGNPDAEDVLRRALAMGADEGLLLSDPAFAGSDAYGTARVLHAAISKRPFDLILTGAVSSDMGAGSVGGMLAAMLDIPQVALATSLAVDGGKATVRHEVEGGLERVVELRLPALVTVQTGLNEPRYVSIRGIRKVSGVEIPVMRAADLELDSSLVGEAGAQVHVTEFFRPAADHRAEILDGTAEEVVDVLIKRLKERGGL